MTPAGLWDVIVAVPFGILVVFYVFRGFVVAYRVRDDALEIRLLGLLVHRILVCEIESIEVVSEIELATQLWMSNPFRLRNFLPGPFAGVVLVIETRSPRRTWLLAPEPSRELQRLIARVQ